MVLLLNVELPVSNFVTMTINTTLEREITQLVTRQKTISEKITLAKPSSHARQTINFDVIEETMKPSTKDTIARAITKRKKTFFQMREPIEDDNERLATKRGDVPPWGLERLAHPNFREEKSSAGLPTNSCTVPPQKKTRTKHGLIVAELSFHDP